MSTSVRGDTWAVLRIVSVASCLGMGAWGFAAGAELDAAARQSAAEILTASGTQGGLIVHLGCGDGRLTAALRTDDRFTIHGLDQDADKVQATRQYLTELGLYGPVSVERWDGRRLPYVDSLVNLVVVSGPLSVDRQEILRVLVPNGVALFGATDNGRRTTDKLVKPRPGNRRLVALSARCGQQRGGLRRMGRPAALTAMGRPAAVAAQPRDPVGFPGHGFRRRTRVLLSGRRLLTSTYSWYGRTPDCLILRIFVQAAGIDVRFRGQFRFEP